MINLRKFKLIIEENVFIYLFALIIDPFRCIAVIEQ